MVNLSKGQRVDVGLRRIVVGLGWDPNAADTGHEFDLDASAFMLDERRKVPAEGFLVFYNNLKSPDGAVVSSGDDRTGGNSDGDDESLVVDLDRLDRRINEIVFAATIHDAGVRRQNFGQVRGSFIRIYDANNPGHELCKYELGEDFSLENAVEFGRLYRRDGAWRFEALGVGYRGNDSQQPLEVFIKKFF